MAKQIETSSSAATAARVLMLLPFYSAVGLFVVGAIVALVAVAPLGKQLKQNRQQQLEFAALMRSQTLEQILSGMINITDQITSRTKAREELESYNRGEIDRTSLVRVVSPILNDALERSALLGGYHTPGC